MREAKLEAADQRHGATRLGKKSKDLMYELDRAWDILDDPAHVCHELADAQNRVRQLSNEVCSHLIRPLPWICLQDRTLLESEVSLGRCLGMQLKLRECGDIPASNSFRAKVAMRQGTKSKRRHLINFLQ